MAIAVETVNGLEIGSRLRRLRGERHMSIRTLVKRSGVPRSTIVDLEQGRRQSTRIDTANMLALGLGVSVSELMGIVEDEPGEEGTTILRVWRRLSQNDRLLVEDFARLLVLKREAEGSRHVPMRILGDPSKPGYPVVVAEVEGRGRKKAAG